MSNVKEFLKAVGMKSKDIDALLDEENKDVDSKALASELKDGIKTDIREAVKNDKEFRDEITREIEGRYAGTWRSVLKKAGLTTEETAEGKSPSDMIKTLTDKLSEGKSKDLQKLETELLEANNKIKVLEEEEIPKIRTEAKREADSVHINSSLAELYKSIDKGRLVSDEHNPAFLKVAMHGLSEQVDWRWEDGHPVAYQKGTDLKAKNADGNKVATAQELLEQQLEKDQFFKKSNGKGGATTTTTGKPAETTTQTQTQGGKVSRGLQEATALLDELKGS